MKKVCFLVDSIFTIGGVQRVTAVIAKELAKTYDVTIVTFDKPELHDESLYGFQGSGIHFRFFRSDCSRASIAMSNASSSFALSQ